jgi:uncharacterized LabA/DUF88 family protein
MIINEGKEKSAPCDPWRTKKFLPAVTWGFTVFIGHKNMRKRLADVLIIITGDSDMVPALKLARQEGMQVGLDPLRHPVDSELSEHVDFISSYV